MVECTGLENRRTERYRGFESLSLRNVVTLSSDYFSLRAPQSQTPYGEMAEWSNAPVLKTGVLRGTGGSNPSLSAKESCKSKDLQDFLFLCFGSPPFWGSKNFCLPLYKVVSYQLNFGIKQINSLPSAEFILPTRHDSPHSYTFSLFHGDNSN